MEKVFRSAAKYGNASGVSAPLALYEAEKEGRLKPGMRVRTVGFGAGLVWGANVIRCSAAYRGGDCAPVTPSTQTASALP